MRLRMLLMLMLVCLCRMCKPAFNLVIISRPQRLVNLCKNLGNKIEKKNHRTIAAWRH